MGLFRLFIIFLTFWVVYRIVKIVVIMLQIKYNQKNTENKQKQNFGSTKVKYVPKNKTQVGHGSKEAEYTDYEEVE